MYFGGKVSMGSIPNTKKKKEKGIHIHTVKYLNSKHKYKLMKQCTTTETKMTTVS